MTHVTLTPIAVTGLHMRHGISLIGNALHVEQGDMYSIWWYMKNGTATEVRTCQCKFQHIIVPLTTPIHIIAYKLSDIWSLLDRNENGGIKCRLKKSWMKSVLGFKILVNL